MNGIRHEAPRDWDFPRSLGMLIVSRMSPRADRKESGHCERLLGNVGFPSANGACMNELGDLAEDDVWSLVDEVDDIKEEAKWTVPAGTGSSTVRHRRWQVPSVNKTGGLSLAFEDSLENSSSAVKIIQQFLPPEDPPSDGIRHSAPVNVPDWSKMLQESSSDYADDCMAGDDDESEWLPPHEYIARESARRQNTATSVFEGVGRTLKGRDMSRVRNAVWRQTGFFG